MITPTYFMDNAGGRLYADAFTNLLPSYSATATKYPVSDKSDINSNVVKQNPTLSITCYVGKNPLKNHAGNLLNGVAKDQRPTTAHEILLKWFNNSTRLTLISEFYQLVNYVIVKYEPKQNQATDSMEYELVLEHLRNVSYTRGKLVELADEDKAIDGKPKTHSNSSGFSNAVKELPDLYESGYINLMGLSNKTNEQTIEDFYNKGK
ncbi:phage baseplate protein [Vibrio antiquarius]